MPKGKGYGGKGMSYGSSKGSIKGGYGGGINVVGGKSKGPRPGSK